jgi:hypothetical protein
VTGKDFNKWVSDNKAAYGLMDEDWDVLKATAVLVFGHNPKLEGGVVATYRNKPVYKEKNKGENPIQPGEAWICTLNTRHASDGYYFASPLEKIDATYLHELKKDQIGEIAEYIFSHHRDSILPELEERFREINEKANEKEVESRVKDYLEQIEGLKREIAEHQRAQLEYEQMIRALSDRGAQGRSCAEGGPAPAFAERLDAGPAVVRIGKSAIRSDLFGDGRYSVYSSSDRKRLLVRAGRDGNIYCVRNTLCIADLDAVSEFKGEAPLTSEYSEQYGGVVIYL